MSIDILSISLWTFFTHNTDQCQISVIILFTDTFKEDTSKSRTLGKTKNEKDRPEPTPEKIANTAELDSLDLGVRRELKFEHNRSVFVICILIEKNRTAFIVDRHKRAITWYSITGIQL